MTPASETFFLEDDQQQERILAVGGALLERARAQGGGLLSGRFYSDALMQWALKDPAFKVRLFRFVDAYPCLSALCPRFDPIAPEAALAAAMVRLLPLLETARDRGVAVVFDMEQSSVQPLTLELFRRCVSRIGGPFGVALQAYLRSAEADARALAEWAHQERKLITVRLVKGAYWDAETVAA